MLQTREPISAHSTSPLRSVAPTATLREAARVLHLETIGAVAVDGEQGIAGVFSERDLVDALAAGADPDVATVGERMTNRVISVRPDDPVLDVALLLLEDGIRHAPVIDDLGRPQGMVSLRDLLRPLIQQAMTPGERPGDDVVQL